MRIRKLPSPTTDSTKRSLTTKPAFSAAKTNLTAARRGISCCPEEVPSTRSTIPSRPGMRTAPTSIPMVRAAAALRCGISWAFFRNSSHSFPSRISSPIFKRFGARVLSSRAGEYAVYLDGDGPVQLTLALPAGQYSADWFDTRTGAIAGREAFRHGGGRNTLESPAFSHGIALRLRRIAGRAV